MGTPTVIHVQATTKALAYMWIGNDDIKAGDWVEVPPNWYKKEPQTLKVVAVGGQTDYKGELTTVSKIVKKADPEEIPF